MIHRWLRVGENRDEITALGGKIDPERIHAETPTHITRLNQLSDRIFGEFIKLFGIEKKYRHHPSR